MKKHLKVAAGFIISALVLLSSVSNIYAALPYYEIEFPRDHAGHQSNIPYEYPNDYYSEWWYFNGVLENFAGDQFFYAVTINQHLAIYADGSGPLMPLDLGQIVITDLENGVTKTKQVYFPEDMTEVSDTELDISYVLPGQSDPLSTEAFTLSRNANTGVFHLKGRTMLDDELLRVNLYLNPTVDEEDALMTNGNGFMEMPEFPWVTSSMYDYSYPEMNTFGVFSFDGETYLVNPCNSKSWMNHQWGDYTPTMFYSWEWFAMEFDNGLVGNVYLNTANPDKNLVSGYASFILPDGTRVYEEIDADFDWSRSDYWTAPNNTAYPMTHELNFESVDLSVTVHSDVAEQFISGPINDVWLGYAEVQGDYEGDSVSGTVGKSLWYSDYFLYN